MIRGTTPTHCFTLPFDGITVKKYNIVYSQNGVTVLKKREGDCTLENNTITLRLTQEETMLFDSEKEISIQLHMLTAGGDALVSNIHTDKAEDCLDNEVLV